MLPFTTETLRKAEVLEKTLGSQILTEDIIESMEIQIESTAGWVKTPLSASNISQEPAPVNLINKNDIMATLGLKQNFRLASIDLDYPGPYEKLFDEPLNYDETPPLAGSVEEELNNVTDDAAHRIADAKFIFGPHHSKCCIATHLDATSDHLPLLTTIGWRDAPNAPKTHQRLKPDSLNSTLFQNLLSSSVKLVAPVPSHSTTDSFYKLAEGIIQAIQLAYSGAARCSLGHSKGYPTHGGTNPERKAERNIYRGVFKRAKESFRTKVDQANTGKDNFAMTKWHKSRGTYRSTPLRRLFLLNNFLVNSTDMGDIFFDVPSVPVRSISLPPLTLQEVRTSVLKIAWPLIKDHIYTLWARCLSVGHHPKCFRHATLVMLQKQNKSDLSSPRFYRHIALLSFLGKGLERLIAKRLAWISVKHKILASQHFGALPYRSAVDLTTCLTHNVERALNEARTPSMPTLDVKGAFDAVLPGRLVRQLREQGWPLHIVRWVGSFATDRMVQIYLDDEMGPPQNITCGLSQGSPVSPILFMLYFSPLSKLGSPLKKFCFAEDIAILAIKNSLSENSQELSNSLAEAIK
ncbi:hypothetical protein EPUL_005538 [Erysiphe pulchra]|uniref:Reverse transcriptase domain-containing protein n=1 Tax=Erysiphe pulchra TaxID=225359 RepID=A0A2S4PSU9_9PEZI|nr:hypothetical protein EPUL_005538 [Erysiphe pulchra]